MTERINSFLSLAKIRMLLGGITMRRYDLYVAKVHWIDSIYDVNDKLIEHIYKYDNFVHIGYSIGVRPLVNYLGNPEYVNYTDSFNVNYEAIYSTKCSYNIKNMYLIIDDTGRIRDYSELAKGVYKSRNDQTYKYHSEPVPYTGKISNYKMFRRIRTTNEKRNCLTSDDIFELSQYPYAKINVGRSKRQSLPSYFDDIKREYQRSWKESFKCNKQYMKNQK